MAELDPYFFGEDPEDSGQDGTGGNVSGFDLDGGCLVRLPESWAESANSGAMYERKAVACGALEAFRSTVFAGDDTAGVMSIIEKLVNDEEQSIRNEIMHQLPQIALFCHEAGPRLDFVVPQHVLPHIVQSLSDKFTQVRKTSQACLLMLLEKGIVAPSQVEEHICPVILEFTESNDDYRTEIVSFMSKLAPLIGKEITVKTYLDRYCSLCDDPMFQVRRVCATSMGDIATVIGTKLTELVLLPKFMALSGDDVWGVRKGAAEVFTIVASVCRLTTRKKKLSPTFVRLLTDPSRWVRVAAYQTLGPLITTFATDDGHTVTPDAESSEAEKTFLYRRGCDTILTIEEDGSSEGEVGGEALATHSNSIEGEKPIDQEEQFQTNIVLKTESSQNSSQSSVIFTPATTASKASDDCKEENNPQVYDNSSESQMEIDECDDEDGGDRKATERRLKTRKSYSEQTDWHKLRREQQLNRMGGWPPLPSSLVTNLEENRKRCHEKSKENSINSDPSGRGDADSSFILYDSSSPPSKSSSDTTDSQTDSIPSINAWSVNNESSSHMSSNNPVSQQVSCTVVLSSKKPKLLHENSIHEETNSNTISTPVPGPSPYSTFQYWRVPLPDILIELDADLVNESSSVSDSDGGDGDHDQTDNDDKNEDALNGNVELDNDASGLKSASVSSSHTRSTSNVTSEITQRVSDVHKSYLNLYNASRDQNGMDEMGLDSLRLMDPYDDDSDDQFASPFPYGEDCSSLWGAKTRSRLLQDIPKMVTPANQDIVPDPLLEHFNSMANLNKEQAVDSELTGYCVYNLPAVVHTMGPQNWSMLRDCYEALACSMQWKVRYTLAASLHEIARVLGPELSERDLVPFYNALTKDLDEVRVGVLRNLSSFVKVLGKEERRKCLETLRSFLETENKRNWRFRLELTNQLELLSEMFEAGDVLKYICPISMDLILDGVAEVRHQALEVVTHLVKLLNNKISSEGIEASSVREFLLMLVNILGHSDRWVRRQTFASLSGQFVELGALAPNQFAQDILPHLIDLSRDKVPNVRLIVAKTLAKCVLKNDFFADPNNPHNEILMCTMLKLHNDPDRDVRFFSADVQSDEIDEGNQYDAEKSQGQSCTLLLKL